MKLNVLYFAWLRERVGEPFEEIETSASDVAGLIGELRARSDFHAAAFEDISAIRVALDQELCAFDTPLEGAREVAFFPPMTGG
jgi:molybdopterin synthase sulfur carrier subunit